MKIQNIKIENFQFNIQKNCQTKFSIHFEKKVMSKKVTTQNWQNRNQ
jgi:hypothetical protein